MKREGWEENEEQKAFPGGEGEERADAEEFSADVPSTAWDGPFPRRLFIGLIEHVLSNFPIRLPG